MNIRKTLTEFCETVGIPTAGLQLPDWEGNPDSVRAVLINEGPPPNPQDYFYSKAADPGDLQSAIPLFQKARIPVTGMDDILSRGIYITTAVKSPKTGYAVEKETLLAHLPILKKELSLFPNLKAIMLMGDVAKKAVNLLYKAENRKNLIPSESTYKIRGNAYYWGATRVFPSYVMTGGNILIEKSKCEMVADDIRRMWALLED